MALLILGLALWWAGHFFKRALPDMRAGMGDRGKLVATVIIVAGVVLMVIGYRGLASPQVWNPPAFMVHINNLLMIIAVYLYAASGTKARLGVRMRHPQLTAVKTWAVAHLLVNGDLASVLLFGGLLAWAVVEVIVINRAQPDWTPPAWKGTGAEVKAVVGTVVVFAIIAAIHAWLGYWPFPG
ncbi:MAG: NnrU family protein [Rhodobacteraceae bacterium]|nr:NnrU family protein [Paracoccaceae bacterium]